MNTGFGRLVGAEVEYAPVSITLGDGSVIATPSDATYLASGWKHVVDSPPDPVDGCVALPQGWVDGAETITRTYMQVPEDELAPPPGHRVFSKLKIINELRKIDKWVLVKAWIGERGYYDYYLAAQNFKEDNEIFTAAIEELKEYAEMTDEEVEAVLRKCIYRNNE